MFGFREKNLTDKPTDGTCFVEPCASCKPNKRSFINVLGDDMAFSLFKSKCTLYQGNGNVEQREHSATCIYIYVYVYIYIYIYIYLFIYT